MLSLSIAIPCHNAATYLSQTLDSLGQQNVPLEIIVVDDGSVDDSLTIAQSHALGIKVLSQPNQGVSVARNEGLRHATGSHVLFLDGDDLLNPLACSQLMTAATKAPESLVIMASSMFRDSNGETVWEKSPPEALFPAILSENPAIIGSWMAPAGLLHRLGGFRTNMAVFEDWEMLSRIAFAGPRLTTIPYCGVRYRRHSASCMATAAASKWAKGHVQVLTSICQQSWCRPELIEQYGCDLIWSAWNALERGYNAGVDAPTMFGLETEIHRLAMKASASLRKLRLVRVVRGVGCLRTYQLRRLVERVALAVSRKPVPVVS